MPYLVSFQKSTQSASRGAVFPLSRQVQWPSEPEKVPGVGTNWASFIMVLLEPSEKIEIWQEVGASTVHVPQVEIDLLERLYTFRGRPEVLWFLGRYPFLVPLVLEAYSKIGDYFPLSQVFLEVFTDPEGIDEDQLVMFIATDLTPDEAVSRLDEFDEDWWLDALDQAQGKLCINVEFR